MTDVNAYGPYFEMTHWVGWNTVLSDINDAADAFHHCSDLFFDSITGSPGSLLSTVWDGTVQMRWYDASDPGSPAVWMEPLGTYTRSTSTTNLPPEAALVITTWCSPYGTTLRRQSLQNRFFLGPWPSNILNAAGRPTTGTLTRLDTAYTAYEEGFDALGVDHSFPVVASPTNGTSSRTEGWWVDDDFDIQRRRGLRPSGYVGTRP